MKITIRNMKKGLVSASACTFEPVSLSVDPSGRYAVAELYAGELFVAARILSRTENELVCDYVNYYSCFNDVPMLMKFTVNWDCLQWGFAKLERWAPELAAENDGFFDATVKRFYFDWELYKRCYQERHGVPCDREDPNAR